MSDQQAQIEDAFAPQSEGAGETVDPFAYITESLEGADPFAEAHPTEGNEQEVQPQDPSEAEVEPTEQRIRDWQSKYDRLQSEFEQYQQISTDNNVINRYMQENPALAKQIYGVIEQSLSGNGSSAQLGEAAAAESPTLPQEPTPPEQPADFNEQDAWMEPTSSSFKYRQAMDAHKMDVLRYENQVLALQMKQMVEPIQQTFQQQQMAAQQRQYLNGIMNAFTETGMSGEEAAQVTQWAQNYELTAEDAAVLYRMRNGQGQPPLQQQQRPAPVEAIKDRNKRLSFPLPASTGAVQPAVNPKAPQDAIFDSLLQADNAGNPWT